METVNPNRLPAMRYQLPALRKLAGLIRTGGRLVEIGCFAGESTRVFLEAGLIVHAIDPWDNRARDRLHEGAVNFDPQHRWGFEMSEAERQFDSVTAPYRARLIKLKGYDRAFAAAFPPASLDGVYIDAVHTYDDTRQIIQRWRAKVRPGGWICGHDYAAWFPGVIRAVKEAFGEPRHVFEDTSWAVES